MVQLKSFLILLFATNCLPVHIKIISLSAAREWRCSFATGNCGIVNQKRMLSNFTLITGSSLFGEQGMFFLESSSCARNGARLMTPYFRWESRVRSVCLSIKYITFGSAIERLSALKQDRVNALLWSESRPNTGQWQEKYIEVAVNRQYPARFFVEARFSPISNRSGFLAISEIALSASYCPR